VSAAGRPRRPAGARQFDAGEGGVYRSVDGGDTWEHVNSGSDAGQDNSIRCAPIPRIETTSIAWAPVSTSRMIWEDISYLCRGIHYERHAMWVDPEDPNHFLLGTDGGLVITWDRGLTFD
jgi:hypothetical protein